MSPFGACRVFKRIHSKETGTKTNLKILDTKVQPMGGKNTLHLMMLQIKSLLWKNSNKNVFHVAWSKKTAWSSNIKVSIHICQAKIEMDRSVDINQIQTPCMGFLFLNLFFNFCSSRCVFFLLLSLFYSSFFFICPFTLPVFVSILCTFSLFLCSRKTKEGGNRMWNPCCFTELHSSLCSYS